MNINWASGADPLDYLKMVSSTLSLRRDRMNALKDASHLFDAEDRAEHAARLGFRISELRLSDKQKVPWHYHNYVDDTFYVISGSLRIFLREPKEEVRLTPAQTFTAKAGRPHLVTNGGAEPVSFLVLQGIGEYDFVPLVP